MSQSSSGSWSTTAGPCCRNSINNGGRAGRRQVAGNKLWIWYFDSAGKHVFDPTGANVDEEARARKTLERMEARVEAAKRTGIPVGELTVKAYGERWLAGLGRTQAGRE